MVQKVSIKNFKSIKAVEFQSRKVNVFLGQPNSGKSNLLEALSLFTRSSLQSVLKGGLRFNHPTELFYDRDYAPGCEVRADGFIASVTVRGREVILEASLEGKQLVSVRQSLDNGGGGGSRSGESPFRYYIFGGAEKYDSPHGGPLEMPNGRNLGAVLGSNKQLRDAVKELLASKGLKLQFHVAESDLSAAKEVDGVIYSYSYPTLSETLRRIIFYMAVLESNRDAILLLDEPEAHTFPFYTKYLAERIGLDPTNQFFLSTHNPYLLQSIVQKTPIKDLAVFITYMRDYQTRLRLLTDAETAALLDPPTGSVADVFFNLDKFVEE